jgi:sugar phosphate isomerase/epimerase
MSSVGFFPADPDHVPANPNLNMTSTPKLLLLSLTTGLTLLAAGAASAAPIPDDCRIGGFAIGCQAYTFNRFSVMEAIEKTGLTGSKVIEFYPGQKLSPDQPNVKWDHSASADVIARVQAQLAKYGVRAVNYGVVSAKDVPEWRQIFEFAKKLGLYAVTTEGVNQFDIIEPLVKEFDIRVAIHNHPRQPNNPDYKVWDPAYVLSMVKDRDARIGACADVGHWATSGIIPLDGIQLLRGRIVSAHLKDRTAIGKSTEDVPFGAGISNFKGILDELKRQGFTGNLSIEYETKWDNSVPDVAQCVGYFRGYGACQ